jgi:hypothetical protein
MLIWLLFIHKIKNWTLSNLCYVHLLVVFLNHDNFFTMKKHLQARNLSNNFHHLIFFGIYHSLYMLS